MHLRAELQNQVRAEVQERPQEVLPLQARVPERPHQEVQYQVHEKVWGGEWFIRMKHENPFVYLECNLEPVRLRGSKAALTDWGIVTQRKAWDIQQPS